MPKKTRIAMAVMAALGSAMFSSLSLAQDAQRVEITGSSIKRIDAETALPVQILKREDIERSGATSTVDLLQRLPVIQGGTVEANSVGGSTYGFSGVSIHNLGDNRTLVLLNGHRLTQFGGQTLTGFAAAFDLNAIPISAIERVEILTDGASALYGSDAIAGVVNFITKRNTNEAAVSIGYSAPKGGAQELRVGASKGFGSLAKDGYNLFLTFAHDERKKLRGADREFAKTGNLVFNLDGKTYRSQNYSASTIPANVLDDNFVLINPYLIATGKCAPNSFRVTDPSTGDDFCGFDYVSTLEIYPERTRDTGMASLNTRIGDHDLFADLLVSQTTQVSRIAPVPGGVSIPAGSQFHNQYLVPLGITANTTAFYRVYDLGLRTSNDKANFYDLSVGSRGVVKGWDYSATFNHSESDVKGGISGYPGALALAALRRSGQLNPFVLPGEQSAAGNQGLASVNYNGYFDGGIAKLDGLQLQASNTLAKLAGGPLAVAAGASFTREQFQSKPSPFAQGITTNPVTGALCDPNDPAKPCDQRFGDAAAQIPYSADRKSSALFGELNIPIIKGLELNASGRYDNYSDFGSSTTYKASFRFTPSKQLLVRGSYGTGFRAPSVPQLKASPQSYGVTEDPYTCTAELQAIAQSLGAQCQPGKRQYDVVAGGNPDLKPEKSRQATLGLRFEPTSSFSLGADVWWVAIKDTFGQLSEATVFGTPSKYPGAWTKATDIGTNTTYLAFNQGNLNLGRSYSSGVDLDVTARLKTAVGMLTSQLNATYMIREVSEDPVVAGSFSSIIGDNSSGAMTYRFRANWRNSLKMGSWTHALNFNYRSGYRDATTTVEVLDGNGLVTGFEDVSLKVKPYYTFDWQTNWDFSKNLTLNVGVLNLFDKKPPFVLNTTGGQQVGYDGNLYDPRGRTVYANASLKF